VRVLNKLGKEPALSPDWSRLLGQAAERLSPDWRPPFSHHGLVLLQMRAIMNIDWLEVELLSSDSVCELETSSVRAKEAEHRDPPLTRRHRLLLPDCLISVNLKLCRWKYLDTGRENSVPSCCLGA
jgi:hypothetical protein